MSGKTITMIQQGIIEGIHKSERDIAMKMLKRGKESVEEIAEITDLPLEEVQELAVSIEMNETYGTTE